MGSEMCIRDRYYQAARLLSSTLLTVIYSQMSSRVTRNGNNKTHQRAEGRRLLDEDMIIPFAACLACLESELKKK